MPEGGELGRRPSCLDVPVQEYVWAHKGASVRVFSCTCGCVRCMCLSSCPSLAERPGNVLSPLGFGFPSPGTAGGPWPPGIRRCPGREGHSVTAATPMSVACPAGSHVCLLFWEGSCDLCGPQGQAGAETHSRGCSVNTSTGFLPREGTRRPCPGLEGRAWGRPLVSEWGLGAVPPPQAPGASSGPAPTLGQLELLAALDGPTHTQPAASEVPPAPEGLFLGPRQLPTHWLPCEREVASSPPPPPPSPSACLPPPPSPGAPFGSHTS